MALIKIKNLTGTSEREPKDYRTWLEYWEAKSGRKVYSCLAYRNNSEGSKCWRSDIVGGHVKKVDSSDNRWYILPICKSHNGSSDYFWAKEKDLVLVNY